MPQLLTGFRSSAMPPILLEVCVDSMPSALAAQEAGAQRIELCAILTEGGLTPSAGMIEVARRRLAMDIFVMVRPRGGHFLYSADEVAIMQRDIQVAKELGANGVVLGLLTADGEIAMDLTAALVEQARPLAVTFHRAFDMVADPHAALESLITIGVERVLTSGLESNAAKGKQMISSLVEQAAGRVVILPGGGITSFNIEEIVRHTGVQEVHMSGREWQPSAMHYHNERITLGNSAVPEVGLQVTSASHIRASLAALSQFNTRNS